MKILSVGVQYHPCHIILMGLAGKDVAMQVACMTTDNLKYDQMNVIYLDMRGGRWNSGYMDIQDNVGHEYTDMDNG